MAMIARHGSKNLPEKHSFRRPGKRKRCTFELKYGQLPPGMLHLDLFLLSSRLRVLLNYE